MQLTLTQVNRITTNKDGTPLMGKNGRPYTRLLIRCNEYGDKSISGFDGKETANWAVGDTVEATVEPRGEYLNFSVPKATHQAGGTSGDLNRVEMKVDRALQALATLGGDITGIKGVLGDILSKLPRGDEPAF